MNGDTQELQKLLKGYRTAVLTTRGADGHFHARPMALQEESRSGELWFATSADSQKCRDLEADPHCALSLHDGGNDATYISLSGPAELVRDRQKVHELWDPSWRAWFPDGPEQEDWVLIHFRPEHVEYVHPATGRLKVLFTMLRRMLTHERVEPAEKKEIEVSH
jgi:PPOX class probable F420-dependent enzyme